MKGNKIMSNRVKNNQDVSVRKQPWSKRKKFCVGICSAIGVVLLCLLVLFMCSA